MTTKAAWFVGITVGAILGVALGIAVLLVTGFAPLG